MNFESYKQLKDERDRLLKLEAYQDVVMLLEDAYKNIPEDEYHKNFFDIEFSKARYYTDCKMYEQCMETLSYLVDHGFICPLEWQRFEPLMLNREYLKLEEKNRLLKEDAQRETKLKYIVYTPANYRTDIKYPLFLVLHGDGGNIEELSENWKPDVLLKKEFIVVYLQSSQVQYHNNYGWLENMAVAEKDIMNCWNSIQQEYSIDHNCLLVGGFSGGAITALDITIANILPSKGFISLCPIMKPQKFTYQNVEQAAKRGVKGVFMEGEKEIPVAAEDDMIKIFRKAGLPYKFIVNKSIGHWFPDDLDLKLEESLRFILG